MLKESTLLSVSLFVLLLIGLSDFGYGCHDGLKHKDPFAPCGSGGGDGSDTLTVKFTEGAFIFDGDASVDMTLKNGSATSGRDQDFDMSEQASDSWDPVFEDCTELLLVGGNFIPDAFSVDGGDLTILPEPDTIYLTLHDIRLPIADGKFAEVTVQLRGGPVCVEIVGGGPAVFPPDAGETIACMFDRSLIHGRGQGGPGGSQGCRPQGSGTPDDSDLVHFGDVGISPSILEIRAP